MNQQQQQFLADLIRMADHLSQRTEQEIRLILRKWVAAEHDKNLSRQLRTITPPPADPLAGGAAYPHISAQALNEGIGALTEILAALDKHGPALARLLP
jgi:hypothetical protein